MDTEKFLDWLMTEKKMSARSAKDVLSRSGRVYRMLGINELKDDTLNLLNNCEQFKDKSMFVKSQLKRTVILCTEFMNY